MIIKSKYYHSTKQQHFYYIAGMYAIVDTLNQSSILSGILETFEYDGMT